MRLPLYLSWGICRDVFEVQMREFAVAQQLEIFEFADAAPEVIRVHHDLDVGMVGFTHEFESGRQRTRESRRAGELEHDGYAERFADLTGFAQIVHTHLEIVFG